MRRYCILLLPVLTLVAACGQPEPDRLRVGDHEFTAFLPEGWEHLDYGQRHELRRDPDRISIEDLGRPGPSIDLVSVRSLKKLGENDRREVASRDTARVGGHRALALTTWETVSHQWPTDYVFVENGDGYLVFFTKLGRRQDTVEVLDALLASVAFLDSLVDGGHQPQ